jgi:short-subunit dehydrogenase
MRRQRILITGATGGFGAGCAIGLARAGHRVVAGGETWQQVRAFRDEADDAGAKLEVIKLDLLNEFDLRHAAEVEPDVLVLNAAVQEAGSIVDVPMELIRRSFEINVFAHLELARRMLPRMTRRKRGRIVWVSSMAGIYAPPWLGTYAATKHAIEAIASVMRTELHLSRISVATINPGLYDTGFNDTGAESYRQWSGDAGLMAPMPPAGPILMAQKDPQQMIDAMVEVIPDRHSAYRTMLPAEAEALTKRQQDHAWTAKAL